MANRIFTLDDFLNDDDDVDMDAPVIVPLVEDNEQGFAVDGWAQELAVINNGPKELTSDTDPALSDPLLEESEADRLEREQRGLLSESEAWDEKAAEDDALIADLQEKLYAARRRQSEAAAVASQKRGDANRMRFTIQAAKQREEDEQRAAEFRAREAEREIEMSSRQAQSIAGFKTVIDGINPEWRHYAMDHQWEGASKLALNESGLLADDMGLGKTLTSIMYCDMVQAKRVLVITPSETCSNFTMEFDMWAKHRFVFTLANANASTRRLMLDALYKPRMEKGEDFVLTINYEQLFTDMDFFAELVSMNWDVIMIDEFHNAKNTKGLLFKRLLTFLANPHPTKFLPITGTFILNKPQDIWPALHLIAPDTFPTERLFLKSYCDFDMYAQSYKFKFGGEQRLVRELGGRIVKRTMEEAGIVLPKMTIHTPENNPSVDLFFKEDEYVDQQDCIVQLAEHMQMVIDETRKVSVIEQIAKITRLRQANVWPAGITFKFEDPETGEETEWSVSEAVNESIKVDWVEDKIKELRNGGKRIAVFSQFKTGLAELEKRLLAEGFRVVRYDGETPRDIKSRVKRDFDRKHVDRHNGEYEWDIVLCNFKAAGVGLNFTHITEMIMLDEEWNPGKNAQAYKRILRMGQTEETNVWIPRVQKTIDGWMQDLNESKAAMIEGFDSEVDKQKVQTNFMDLIAELKEGVSV